MNYNSRIFIRKNLFLFCLLILTSGCDSRSSESVISSENKKDLAEYCKTHECRRDLKFTLRTPEDTYFKFSSSLSEPVVQENIIGKEKNYLVTLYPEETIHIAFDPGDDGPENLRSVSNPEKYANTLTFKLSQEENIANGIGMKLYINNPTKYYIKYWLFMSRIEEKKPEKVRSCPLKPESDSFLTLEHPVFMFSMGKFLWTNETDLDCR